MNTKFTVLVRRLATGCDYRINIFAKDAERAMERAKDHARFDIGMRKAKLEELSAKGIAVFRVVSCDVAADQSRPLVF